MRIFFVLSGASKYILSIFLLTWLRGLSIFLRLLFFQLTEFEKELTHKCHLYYSGRHDSVKYQHNNKDLIASSFLFYKHWIINIIYYQVFFAMYMTFKILRKKYLSEKEMLHFYHPRKRLFLYLCLLQFLLAFFSSFIPNSWINHRVLMLSSGYFDHIFLSPLPGSWQSRHDSR